MSPPDGRRWGFALTELDEVRGLTLHATAWHLEALARNGQWDAQCDRIADRLATLGLGRN